MNKTYNINTIRNNKGFTLVELLATVSLVSLVIVIVIYTATSIINNAKSKGYNVTISNIEKISNDYVLENSNRILWVSELGDSYEYQCVTVQDLIDSGYFKSDILESYVNDSVKVNGSDYVYLERDKNNKAITKNILLVNGKDSLNQYIGLCPINTSGNIVFGVVPFGWAKEKNVTITYGLFNNSDNVSNYSYSYIFDKNNNVKKNGKFNKTAMKEVVTVFENGTINAVINNSLGDSITASSLNVNKIDNTKPQLKVSVIDGNVYAKSRIATVKLIDNESGFKKGQYEIKYDWSINTKSCDELTKSAILIIDTDNANTGSISFEVSEGTGIGKLYVCGVDIGDYVGNELDSLAIADVYLDNLGPTIIENYTGDRKVGNSVTIPLIVTDSHSLVNGDSFTSDDIVVTVGNTVINDVTLKKIDNNNYQLTIINNNSAGDLKIVIDKDKVFDNASNGNEKVEFDLDIIFDNVYTISYDANGGEGAPASETKKQGVDIKISSTIPTRKGYIFTGWNTMEDGSGTSYATGDNYSDNASVILYAQWESHGDKDHVWNAIGNSRLQTAGLFEFTCKYYHNYGYPIYCSVCGMSVRHYRTVVHAGEGLTQPAQWSCTCSPITYSIIWNDSILKDSNPSKARDNLASVCGLTCGQSLFKKGDTNFVTWCAEDHTADRIVPSNAEN